MTRPMRVGRVLTLAGSSAVILAGLAASQAAFLVHQGESVLVRREGRPVRIDNANGRAPGLYLRWPGVESLQRVDRRTLAIASGSEAAPSADRDAFDVSAAALYRITDPWRFAGDGAGAARLQAIVDTAVRTSVGHTPAARLQGEARGELASSALAEVRRFVRADRLGAEVQALDILDVQPAGETPAAAVDRLRQDLQARAVQVHADGEAQKRAAIAQAEGEAATVRGEGERQALEIRGQGDAERAGVLAVAYGADPDFARFFRRLEAYDQALDPGTTTMVLAPGSGFLDVFGRGPQPAR